MIPSPVAAAFGLDLALGDPAREWHPVRLMGRAVAAADSAFPRNRFSGALLALGLPALVAAAAWFALKLAGSGAWLLDAVLIFFCVAGQDMARHANAVLQALEEGDLGAARLAVGRIVGRDTAALDQQSILRACIESVAESYCDGMLAPLFYAFLGAAPLALAHKAVSTLDSMIGYRNEKYAAFGWASARLDDLLNWLPARLAAVVVALSCARPFRSLAAAMQGGSSQPSPNAGWPEAAFAGALGVQLGGLSSYQGVSSDKALLGLPERPLSIAVGRQAVRLFQRASWLALLIGELLWHWLRA